MTRQLRNKITLSAFIVLSLVTLTGFGCRPRAQEGNVFEAQDVKLSVWGLWQTSEQMAPILNAFTEQTGAEVTYKKIASVAEYERELLEALALGRAPDIFVVHHTWPATKQGIMTPAPSDVIDERTVREEFVDVVAEDVVQNGQVLALPVSVDTLALYYNKDLLAASGVARPPRTWSEMQQVVERMHIINRFGTIERSAAALGTAQNISRAADILQLLFLQSGLDIASGSDNKIDIVNEVGERALTFYTDFANKSKKVYTWDLQQDYSIDAFAEGETAMMINYSYHVPTITAKNPRLRFAIAPVPQIADGTPANFAAYWPFTVSSQSVAPEAAWQFVKFMTSPQQMASLNQSQKTPPARRDLVSNTNRDPLLGPFVEQTLTAKTWHRGDIVAIDAIFNAMIDNVVIGATTISDSIAQGQAQINQLQPAGVEPAPVVDPNAPSSGGFGGG